MTGASSNTAAPDSSSLGLTIMPKLDVQFSPTAKLNPFVGAMLGLGFGSASSGLENQAMTMA